MKAIILAAGRGSRMNMLTINKPKCMIKLKNKPLLHYQIEALQSAGIKDIGIVCGYKKEKITHHAITKKFENTMWESSNMVRSLMSATAWLEHDTCIISYSDIFYDTHAVNLLIAADAAITITYDSNFKKLWSLRFDQPLSDLETFQINSASILTDIGNRAKSWEEVQGQYMGLLKFNPRGWRIAISALNSFDEQQVNCLDLTGLLKHLVHSHEKIQAIPFSGIWGEVDHPSDLALYETWNW